MKEINKKNFVIACILALVGLIQLSNFGHLFHGEVHNLYCGYIPDFIIPFAVYFLLCSNQILFPFLKPWYIKALIVFSMASIAELIQYAGFDVLGSTYDPYDFLMYAGAVLFASILDTLLFPKIFKFWNAEYIDDL